MLIKDVMYLPRIMRQSSREPSDIDSEFNSEAIELMVRLMCKDTVLMKQFAEAGADSKFISELKAVIEEFDLGFEESNAVKELEVIKQTLEL